MFVCVLGLNIDRNNFAQHVSFCPPCNRALSLSHSFHNYMKYYSIHILHTSRLAFEHSRHVKMPLSLVLLVHPSTIAAHLITCTWLAVGLCAEANRPNVCSHPQINDRIRCCRRATRCCCSSFTGPQRSCPISQPQQKQQHRTSNVRAAASTYTHTYTHSAAQP